MGVHGLTTYLHENRRALSRTVELAAYSNQELIPVVIDGWSFIYTLYHNSGLSWVYGGEYREYHELVKTIVRAWLKVGLRVYFVFDGAYPDLKFPTLVTRLSQSSIQPGLLFFRTSTASRSTPRSLNETRILPPLVYATCINALKEVQADTDALEIHFADEEGDPYAVELAGRLHGYVVGNDSDFVVLYTEGYRGYIPIDEMVWRTPSSNGQQVGNNDDDDFQVVVRPKTNRKAQTNLKTGNGIIPPVEEENLLLSVTSYSPTVLAGHFRLPVTLLPLLGAIVGNDFTTQMESNKRRIQGLLFERHLSATQRVGHAASVIRTVLTPNPNNRKGKHEVGSVMDLIERTVTTLLSRFEATTMGTGEVGQVIENIVEATLQYAIPKSASSSSLLWPTQVCALHTPDACLFLPMVSRRLYRQLQEIDVEDEELLQIREKVIQAYRIGSFTPKMMDVLSTATFWPRLFLEDPDAETLSRSIGRPVREWVYSILDDAVGIPDPPVPEVAESDRESELEEEEEEEEENELIDVVESDSEDEVNIDLLAPLKGELNRLHPSEDEASEPPRSVSSHRPERSFPLVVTEYIRRGTRVAQEAVNVTPLKQVFESIELPDYGSEDAPLLLLRPEVERLEVMLRLLKANTPSIKSLPPTKVIPVLVVRWIAQILHSRALETGSKERGKEIWSAKEARCFLASFASEALKDEETGHRVSAYPEIIDRHVQLTAQALAAFEAIQQLSESLLLGERVPPISHKFSGEQFHRFLNNVHTPGDVDGTWAAVEDQLSVPLKEDAPKKSKRDKGTVSPPKMGKGAKGNSGRRGFYALEME